MANSSKIQGTALKWNNDYYRKKPQGNSKSLINGQQPSKIMNSIPAAGYDSDSPYPYNGSGNPG